MAKARTAYPSGHMHTPPYLEQERRHAKKDGSQLVWVRKVIVLAHRRDVLDNAIWPLGIARDLYESSNILE